MDEMGLVLDKAPSPSSAEPRASRSDSLLQRKYVIPFVLACLVLSFNQTTGINSVLAFLVLILKQAGLSATHATQGDVVVKVINCVMTLVGVALVDRRGRKFLLRLGTGGIVVAFLAAGLLFWGVESHRTDVRSNVVAAESGNVVSLPLRNLVPAGSDRPVVLSVLYNYGKGSRMEAVSTADPDPTLIIRPEKDEAAAPLTITQARFGAVPPPATGWIITFSMGLFIAS